MKSSIQIILHTITKPKLNNTIVSGVIFKFLFVKIHLNDCCLEDAKWQTSTDCHSGAKPNNTKFSYLRAHCVSQVQKLKI